MIVLGHYINQEDLGTLGSKISGSEEHPALFPGLVCPGMNVAKNTKEFVINVIRRLSRPGKNAGCSSDPDTDF